MMGGKVFLVGAGPGDPGLITLKGLDCIRRADVLIYDRLVDPALLEEAPPCADRIYAGKHSKDHALDQDLIHELMVMHARLGKTVVRLKGGDPFVFGRGGEETAYLSERRIPFEVVPGVSSCIAVPAFSGIPVTCRGVSAGFAVTTGHGCGRSSEPDYAAMLRSAGTLVILMGISNLQRILDRMLEGGIDPDTPVAIVEQGTLPGQRTHTGTLKTFRDSPPDAHAPAVIVAGQVVLLRDRVLWFSESHDVVNKIEAGSV